MKDTPRRVLITGGSGALGRATALALARDGFHVVASYHTNQAGAEETAAAVSALGGSVRTLAFDVAQRQQCAEVLQADVAAHGSFWGVVCNAGVHQDAPFPALSGGAWDRVLRTNLDGFYNVLRPLAMPMIRAHRGGRIVAISSVSGLTGRRGQVNYSASKAGLIGAAKALAQELAKRKITVNCVAPGVIETDMIEGAALEEVRNMIPMRRFGTPADVAAAVAFFFSPGADYVTGQVLSVNGGML